MFPVMDLGPKWTSHAASLNDWITLAGDSDCDALRLWRLGQHERLLEKHAIELLNPAGLLNLYAHWQNSGYSLIPRSLDLKLPHKLLVLEPDIGHGFRVNAKQQKDEHCVRSHQDNRWVRLLRNTRTLNPDHRDTPIYGDIELVQNGQLLACTDVFPWRFRRGLSLYAKPLVKLSDPPNSWIVSASHLRRAVRYILENIERGRFPQRHFRSADMKRFIGEIAHKKGHDFAAKVSAAMRGAGLSVQSEVNMTALGAPAAPDLGDVDVLAWDFESGKVFIVECKRLIEAVTVTEAVQRLEEFKGDPTEADRLTKHLRRVDWLQQNPSGIGSITDIPVDRVELVPLLVTSDLVPMEFLKEVKFPAEQFVDFERLAERLAACGFPRVIQG